MLKNKLKSPKSIKGKNKLKSFKKELTLAELVAAKASNLTKIGRAKGRGRGRGRGAEAGKSSFQDQMARRREALAPNPNESSSGSGSTSTSGPWLNS